MERSHSRSTGPKRPQDPPSTDAEDWMRTADVARELGYSPAWVRQQITSGLLRAQAHLTGRRPSLRIRRRDFVRFVEEQFSDTESDVRRLRP